MRMPRPVDPLSPILITIEVAAPLFCGGAEWYCQLYGLLSEPDVGSVEVRMVGRREVVNVDEYSS